MHTKILFRKWFKKVFTKREYTQHVRRIPIGKVVVVTKAREGFFIRWLKNTWGKKLCVNFSTKINFGLDAAKMKSNFHLAFRKPIEN